VTGGKQSKERLKADEFCRVCLEEKTKLNLATPTGMTQCFCRPQNN